MTSQHPFRRFLFSSVAAAGLLLGLAPPATADAVAPTDRGPVVRCAPEPLCAAVLQWTSDETITIDLDSPYPITSARFFVELGPSSGSGIAFSVGNSPSNDGFGGDGDDTVDDAEIQLRDDATLGMYGSDRTRPSQTIDDHRLLGRTELIAPSGLAQGWIEVRDRQVVAQDADYSGDHVLRLDPDFVDALYVGVNASPSGTRSGEALRYLQIVLGSPVDVTEAPGLHEPGDRVNGPTRIDDVEASPAAGSGGATAGEIAAWLTVGVLVGVIGVGAVQMRGRSSI